MEAVVTLAMTLRRFEFSFDEDKLAGKDDIHDMPWGLNHPVGMRTGATIHMRNGLHMNIKRRQASE